MLAELPRRLRGIRRRIRRKVEPVLLGLWRRLMFRTTVIAITGSVGKTTAKEVLAAILATRGRTLKTRNNENDDEGVARTLRALRPWHRFAVIEVGTGKPGTVARSARLVRPDIAVVLGVARTHTNVFASLDETAREKASLLRYLAPRGVAILNADDPRVRAMTPLAGTRIVTFGADPEAGLRLLAASARWPARLALDVAADEARIHVQSQLVGIHWTPSLLGALAAARACGVPPAAATRAVETVEPFTARMQPVVLPGGAIAIRDEGNGSPDTLDAMFAVLRDARARRRVLVFSDLSDSRRSPRKRLRDIGALAAALTDLAIFVGGSAHHAVRGAMDQGMARSACHAFASLEDAAALLRRELRDGDLVFIKGRATDHLSRILFAQFGPIGCWLYSCPVRRPCDLCDRLQPSFALGAALSPASPSDAGLHLAELR